MNNVWVLHNTLKDEHVACFATQLDAHRFASNLSDRFEVHFAPYLPACTCKNEHLPQKLFNLFKEDDLVLEKATWREVEIYMGENCLHKDSVNLEEVE